MTASAVKRLRWLLALLVIAAALAFAVVAAGVISVKASSDHFAVTRWFLHFAMRRSVATHTLGLQMEALDQPWLVLKGAGHFETGCRPCHGAPDLEAPVIPRGMTPHPPPLAERVRSWEARELFYIVKHGVKFTGMPAWPALQRDDEVRAVVAFLLKLPELDGSAYRALVHGPEEELEAAAPTSALTAAEYAPNAALASCARCHGLRGEGRGSAAFPKLVGQTADYQVAALVAYAQGTRHSGIMQPIAAGLRREQMQALAAHYANAEPTEPATSGVQVAAVERGRAIATQGIPSLGVPACADCHGPVEFPRNPMYPNLAGQYADYLFLQLELFKAGKRGGSPYAHLMQHVATRLGSEQMRDVAEYYSTLRPGTPTHLRPHSP